jgi:hypothetical protein
MKAERLTGHLEESLLIPCRLAKFANFGQNLGIFRRFSENYL